MMTGWPGPGVTDVTSAPVGTIDIGVAIATLKITVLWMPPGGAQVRAIVGHFQQPDFQVTGPDLASVVEGVVMAVERTRGRIEGIRVGEKVI